VVAVRRSHANLPLSSKRGECAHVSAALAASTDDDAAVSVGLSRCRLDYVRQNLWRCRIAIGGPELVSRVSASGRGSPFTRKPAPIIESIASLGLEDADVSIDDLVTNVKARTAASTSRTRR
jgi:hypothetical protein